MTQTATIEPETDERPEPIRIIRKVKGLYQWVDVLPSELTDDECREIFVAAFSPCGAE